jgi:hypothetical protein
MKKRLTRQIAPSILPEKTRLVNRITKNTYKKGLIFTTYSLSENKWKNQSG